MDDTPDAAVPRPAHDLTPIVDLTLRHGAGPFRTRLPSYVSLLPPCNHACPAGENIQAWLALAQAGDYRRAWETLMADNPLPARMAGSATTRAKPPAIAANWTAAVSIHAVERFLGDMATPKAGLCPSHPRPASGSWCGRRTERPVRRLSARQARPPGRDPRGGSAARRHAAFRHPRLPAAACRPAGGRRNLRDRERSRWLRDGHGHHGKG